MRNFHILVIVVLGLFLMPSTIFACEKHSDNNSCTKEISSKFNKREDCCNSENHSVKNESSKSENHSCCDSDGQNSKNDHSCNGKCGHSKCTPSHSFNGFLASLDINIKNNVFDFSNERQKFYQSETFVSSGFCSLWLIPKIS